MKNQYDVIVIGGGHNGLTTATILAKKGKTVLLLERRNILGGIAAKEEFHPGYFTNGLLHDTSQVRQKIVEQLDLETFGLKIQNKRADFHLFGKDGKHINITNNVDEVGNTIVQYSKTDAEAYIKYQDFLKIASGFIKKLMNQNLPNVEKLDFRQLFGLAKTGYTLKRLGNKNMHEFLKVGPMCVADFLNEFFETDFIKAGLALPALLGSYNGPWSAFTTLNLLIWECLSETFLPGGPSSLTDALEKAARSAGVNIQTEAEVKQIIQSANGEVTGVLLKNGNQVNSRYVAASCSPKTSFLELLDPRTLDYTLENSFIKYRDRGTTAKMNIALNKPIVFKALEGESVEFARTGNSFNEMEKAFDHIKYREFSNDPVLDIYVPTISNPELAPPGHCVTSVLVHFAPYHLETGWSQKEKEKLEKNILQSLSQYTHDFSASMVATELLCPKDIEERYGLINGHIFHGEHAPDQILMRPISTCSQYATPIKGLYLCGSGSHPGGGLTCGPGWLAGKEILKDWRD